LIDASRYSLAQRSENAMSLAGTGAVAIWHDIAPEGRDVFYAWHSSEHMPERAGIAGFLRGRRYAAIEGSPEFFNLYETTSPAVLTGVDYLARLNAPTPWTAATVRHFRNVSRSLCTVACGHGQGDGGLIATYRYDIAEAAAPAHRERLRTRLPTIARERDIAGAHLLVADPQGSAIETAEKRARGEATLIPRWIVLLECWGDVDPFVATARRFATDAVFADASEQPAWAVYRLQNTRDAPRHDR
jgi:hypothetical protein